MDKQQTQSGHSWGGMCEGGAREGDEGRAADVQAGGRLEAENSNGVEL